MAKYDAHFKAAQDLWAIEARNMKPEEFQAKFAAIYDATDNIDTLWQLGGAVNDYLRSNSNPSAVKVPDELAPKLLEASRVDCKIIGLKLLVRCSNDLPTICREICRAFDRGDDWSGLCELSNVLDRMRPPTSIPVRELRLRLHGLKDSCDEDIRACSKRLDDLLSDFCGD